MAIVLTVIHVLVSIFLIFLVLIQDSKGGGLGGISGGNANTLLGATGATTLAAKMTRWTAIAFAISCLSLAVSTSKSKKSVIDGMPVANKAVLGAGVGGSPLPSSVPNPETTTAPSGTEKAAEQKSEVPPTKK